MTRPRHEVCSIFFRSNANSKTQLLRLLLIISVRDREMGSVGSSSIQTLAHWPVSFSSYVLSDCLSARLRQLDNVSSKAYLLHLLCIIGSRDRKMRFVRSSSDPTLTHARICSRCYLLPDNLTTWWGLQNFCTFQRHLWGAYTSILCILSTVTAGWGLSGFRVPRR